MVSRYEEAAVTAMLPPVPEEPEPGHGHHADADWWRSSLDAVSRWIVTHPAAFWGLVACLVATAMTGGYIAGVPAAAGTPPPAAEASRPATEDPDVPLVVPAPPRARAPKVRRKAPAAPAPSRTRRGQASRSPKPTRVTLSPSPTPTPSSVTPSPSPEPTESDKPGEPVEDPGGRKDGPQ